MGAPDATQTGTSEVVQQRVAAMAGSGQCRGGAGGQHGAIERRRGASKVTLGLWGTWKQTVVVRGGWRTARELLSAPSLGPLLWQPTDLSLLYKHQ